MGGESLGDDFDKPPVNVGDKLLLVAEIINDAVYQHALNRTFMAEWPPHHALSDARAIMAGYRAWMEANRENLRGLWSVKGTVE